MKTEYQILQELTRLENLDVSQDVDYSTRINALQWVLDGEDSAMCEANSNAVLGEITVLLREAVETDGGHHKQWFLEQIALKLNIDLPKHEEGIAP